MFEQLDVEEAWSGKLWRFLSHGKYTALHKLNFPSITYRNILGISRIVVLMTPRNDFPAHPRGTTFSSSSTWLLLLW